MDKSMNGMTSGIMSDDLYDFEVNPELQDYFMGVFKTFDKLSEEKIAIEDLGTAVRCCGMAPTEADILSWVKAHDDGTGKIPADEFIVVVKKAVSDYKGLEALKDGFRACDPNLRGFLPPHELRYLLTNFGEKFTDEEITEFLAETVLLGDIDTEGNVNYESFSMKLMPDFMQ